MLQTQLHHIWYTLASVIICVGAIYVRTLEYYCWQQYTLGIIFFYYLAQLLLCNRHVQFSGGVDWCSEHQWKKTCAHPYWSTEQQYGHHKARVQ